MKILGIPKMLLLLLLIWAGSLVRAEESTFNTMYVTRHCYSSAGPQFSLGYVYRRPKRPNGPTVVFFPGGPGSSSSDTDGWPIPTDYGVVLLDPRGTGLNEAMYGCEGSYELSTLSLAKDAEAIIETLDVSGGLYLYGVSYGTAVATVTAKLRENAGKKTDFLVLEGAFGRSLREREFIAEFRRIWGDIWARLPFKVRELLSNERPLGVNENLWGAWIEDTLAMGALPSEEEPIFNKLKAIGSSEGKLRVLAELENSKQARPMTKSQKAVFKAIGCHELVSESSESDHNLILHKGKLEPSIGNFCNGEPLDRPFDAKQWNLKKTSVIYFKGTRDPITTDSVSNHHIEANDNVPRAVVLVHGGGHNSLSVSLADCAESVFRKISNSNGLRSALALCNRKTELIISKPAE